jgi:hypothetical protein
MMTMLLTLVTMLAFAGVYALIATMIGDHWPAITLALAGGRRASVQPARSRAFSRA